MERNRAQSIMEYVVAMGVVAMALVAMQLYFRRSIQAVIKTAADEVGDQKKGAVDVDYKYEWKVKTSSLINANTTGERTTTIAPGGAIEYGKSETSMQEGELSRGVFSDEE